MGVAVVYAWGGGRRFCVSMIFVFVCVCLSTFSVNSSGLKLLMLGILGCFSKYSILFPVGRERDWGLF